MINRDWGHPGPVRRNPHMVNLWAASVSDEAKQVRRTYLLVQVWPMVQDREHKRIPRAKPSLRMQGKAALRLSLVSHWRIWHEHYPWSLVHPLRAVSAVPAHRGGGGGRLGCAHTPCMSG